MQRGAAEEDAKMSKSSSVDLWSYPTTACGEAAARRIKARMFEDDYRAMLALNDARRADLAASREQAMNNAELRAQLLADARRRGQSEIDWPEYFRSARMV